MFFKLLFSPWPTVQNPQIFNIIYSGKNEKSKSIRFIGTTLTGALAGIYHTVSVYTIQCCSAPGDLVVDCWALIAQSAGGVFDGELLLLRLFPQPDDMAVRELGPDGPGYR